MQQFIWDGRTYSVDMERLYNTPSWLIRLPHGEILKVTGWTESDPPSIMYLQPYMCTDQTTVPAYAEEEPPTSITRPIIEYTIQHIVSIELGRMTREPGQPLVLHGITSNDKEEDFVLSDKGMYACFDGEARLMDSGIRIEGGDQPGGGATKTVILHIPCDKIGDIHIVNSQ